MLRISVPEALKLGSPDLPILTPGGEYELQVSEHAARPPRGAGAAGEGVSPPRAPVWVVGYGGGGGGAARAAGGGDGMPRPRSLRSLD